jgi:hypothetical protein
MFTMILDRYDLGKLLTKLGGVGGSFVASHLVALTTTPDYANFWSKLYLTAPTITNVPAFEKMVGTYFALIWIGLEHFYWRVQGTPTQHQRADDAPKEIQK